MVPEMKCPLTTQRLFQAGLSGQRHPCDFQALQVAGASGGAGHGASLSVSLHLFPVDLAVCNKHASKSLHIERIEQRKQRKDPAARPMDGTV